MGARRLPLTALPRRELLLAAVAAGATALVAFAGMHKLGTASLLAPLAVVLAAILLVRPVVAVAFVVLLTVLCEGPSFGLLTFTSKLYEVGYKDITLVDGLVALAIVSVGLDLIRQRRAVRLPRPLIVPYVTLALAMVSGVVVGHAAGASLRFTISSEHVLAYLLLLPLAVANLDLDRRQVTWLLGGAAALAIVKALLGLVEVAGHLGTSIEGVATLSYYEPDANWLIMIAILTRLRRGPGTCQAAAVDAARQPAAGRLPAALIPALVLDRGRPRAAAGADAGHLAGRAAPARARGAGRCGGDLAARFDPLPRPRLRS